MMHIKVYCDDCLGRVYNVQEDAHCTATVCLARRVSYVAVKGNLIAGALVDSLMVVEAFNL